MGGSLITRKTRTLLEQRSGGVCEVCARQMATNTHHRRPRGMGGSRDPVIDSVVNLLRLCGSGTTGCHGVIEANRQRSYDLGLLVRHTVSDIAAVPVDLACGRVLLGPDGTYVPV